MNSSGDLSTRTTAGLGDFRESAVLLFQGQNDWVAYGWKRDCCALEQSMGNCFNLKLKIIKEGLS